MSQLPQPKNQIQRVTNFEALVATPFGGVINAMCWQRMLVGNFEEIVSKIATQGNLVTINIDKLKALELSEQGQIARNTLLSDFKLLQEIGASPTLNIIKCYERDNDPIVFPTDVYSFHVDRSPVPTHTYLCTYHGASSEIISNNEAVQKIHIPEIRAALNNLYNGPASGFEAFLTDNFFDLHYQPIPNAKAKSLGIGHMWKLAVDHPNSQVPPCIHRAPEEKDSEPRLLLIC